MKLLPLPPLVVLLLSDAAIVACSLNARSLASLDMIALMGLPPARAWCSSTSELPRMFLVAILSPIFLRGGACGSGCCGWLLCCWENEDSSQVDDIRLRPLVLTVMLEVTDAVSLPLPLLLLFALSLLPTPVTDGILLSRRVGLGLRSRRAGALGAERRGCCCPTEETPLTVLERVANVCLVRRPCIGRGFDFCCELSDGLGLVAMGLKGFLLDLTIGFGEGTRASASDSSPESIMSVSLGISQLLFSLGVGSPPKIILGCVVGGFVRAIRRGDRERESIVTGDGEAISMSIGVPRTDSEGAEEYVCALWKGVRGIFLVMSKPSVDSAIEISVMSVVEGKSPSPLPTEDWLKSDTNVAAVEENEPCWP